MVLSSHKDQAVLVARLLLWAGLTLAPGGFLLQPELGWTVVGGAAGFAAAGFQLMRAAESREDALTYAGTRLVLGGVAIMVGTAALAIAGGAQQLMDGLHSMGLTAALSGAGMRLFSGVARWDHARRCARGWQPFTWETAVDAYADDEVEQTVEAGG